MANKTCFVVSEFGTDEKTRLERKQTLKHLVRKVLEPMGYAVQRADDIDDLGQITHQIIERLLDDDLVVADLTGLNPNVFYELAVRHAARKPVITLMADGVTIPFDLKDVRTVFYDLHDPDALEQAQEELAQKARAIEDNPTDIRNPITVARNVSLLQSSDDPDDRIAGTMLEAINDLRDEVRRLGAARVTSAKPPALVLRQIVQDSFTPLNTEDITLRFRKATNSPLSLAGVRRRLTTLAEEGVITRLDADLWGAATA